MKTMDDKLPKKIYCKHEESIKRLMELTPEKCGLYACGCGIDGSPYGNNDIAPDLWLGDLVIKDKKDGLIVLTLYSDDIESVLFQSDCDQDEYGCWWSDQGNEYVSETFAAVEMKSGLCFSFMSRE